MNTYDGINKALTPEQKNGVNICQQEVGNAWKSACKILLGGEIGELEQFEDYLYRYIGHIDEKNSVISGKPVTISGSEICDNGKIIENEEIGEYEQLLKGVKLDINSIKDIDSILEVVGEKLYYSGGITLGNSKYVQKSNRCVDSSFVYKSMDVYEGCKYVALSDQARKCEYVFGVGLSGENNFIIRGHEVWKDTRCFEAFRTYNASDCYFVANLEGCNNCMFSFNQRNKSNLIGNLQLSKDEYLKLKQKLVEDIRNILKEKKTIPGIVEIIAYPHNPLNKSPESMAASSKKTKTNIAPKEIEIAFQRVTETILGKKLVNIIDYEKWLTKHSGKVIGVKSKISDEVVYVPPLESFVAIKDSAIKEDEALEYGKKKVNMEELDGLTPLNAGEKLKEIKLTTPEITVGETMNIVECSGYGVNTAHAFRGSFIYADKCAAYSYFIRNSEYIFGSSLVFLSKYCINCYHSQNLTRCFEVSDSTNCSDCYFCHNCEALSNCMFCFNTKSKRYAIANVEVGPEEYGKIKKLVLEGLAKRIETDRGLDIDIYNVGCWKKPG